MRIALVNPNTYTPYPQPPLGLLSIATVCRAHGHDVRIVDANAANLSSEKVVALVELSDLIGITATSLSYPEAEFLAQRIRKEYLTKFIVLGGVHATLAPDEVMKAGIFDAVVVGEGEKIMLIMLDILEKGIYQGGIMVDLDTIPPLAYDLLDGRYRAMAPHGLHKPFMPVLTSRGCPFQCSFCSKAVFGSTYRAKSVQGVIDEINRLVGEFGIREIIFYDDVFTMDKRRTVELSNRIAGRVSWACEARVNLVDKDVLQAMKRGGCYAVAYGIESGDPGILRRLSKNITPNQVEQAVRYSKEAGLRVIGYFMLGSPGETPDTIKQTINWAIKLGIDYAQFSITTPLPGSELYEMVPESRRANSYAMVGQDHPGLCSLDTSQLSKAVSRAYRRFYLRPGYILQQVRRMAQSWSESRMVLDGFRVFLRGGN